MVFFLWPEAFWPQELCHFVRCLKADAEFWEWAKMYPVHLCVVFSLCWLLIVFRGDDGFFHLSLPLYLSPPPIQLKVFLHLTHCFHLHLSTEGVQWAFSEWQLACEHQKTPCKEIVVLNPWVLVVLCHVSPERELFLCGQYCRLQSKPYIYTHNITVVNKIHSLHPIPQSTPSHFVHSILIYFW